MSEIVKNIKLGLSYNQLQQSQKLNYHILFEKENNDYGIYSQGVRIDALYNSQGNIEQSYAQAIRTIQSQLGRGTRYYWENNAPSTGMQNGDVWINLLTNDVSSYDGSKWVHRFNLNGTAGAQGNIGMSIQGAQGAQGIKAAQGAQGTQGIKGDDWTGTQGTQGLAGLSIKGAQGAKGTNASQGAQGTQGIKGDDWKGTQGAKGATGNSVQGVQGAKGSSGSQGLQGTRGANGNDYVGAQGNQGGTGELQIYTKRRGHSNTSNIMYLGGFDGTNQGFKTSIYVTDSYAKGGELYAGSDISLKTNIKSISDEFINK